MSIGDRVFKLIKERGLTQKEFSKRTGIAESTISDWKRKRLNPGADKLPVICKVLNVSADELLDIGPTDTDHVVSADTNMLVEKIKDLPSEMQTRLEAYVDVLLRNSDVHASGIRRIANIQAEEADKDFQIRKDLTRKLRKLARLSRLRIDESEHESRLNLHLFKYLDFLGLEKLEFIRDYLSHIQPYMISEIKSQEKFDNAICVLDEYYRISVYIKVDATNGEEIVVSFHENNKGGIARRNPIRSREDMVYVFADSVGSHVEGTDDYSVNVFIMRGVRTFPLSIAAIRYDDDGFLVRSSDINNALTGICNRYLEDLYTSDLDINGIELFSSLQQLSFTSFGNDVFSNISLLIDSLIVRTDAVSRQIADAALCIYCGTVSLVDSDRKELLETLKIRFKVNSVRIMPQILERIELNLA